MFHRYFLAIVSVLRSEQPNNSQQQHQQQQQQQQVVGGPQIMYPPAAIRYYQQEYIPQRENSNIFMSRNCIKFSFTFS